MHDPREVFIVAAVDAIHLSARVTDNEVVGDMEIYRRHLSERVVVLSDWRVLGEWGGGVAELPDGPS